MSKRKAKRTKRQPRSVAAAFAELTRKQARRLKGARTRAERKEARRREYERRQEAGRKGWRIRRAKRDAAFALGELTSAVEQTRRIPKSSKEQWAETTPKREGWREAKERLRAALEYDVDDFFDALDEIADVEGVDWELGYTEAAE